MHDEIFWHFKHKIILLRVLRGACMNSTRVFHNSIFLPPPWWIILPSLASVASVCPMNPCVQGLVIFCWTDEENNKEIVQHLKSLGIHGIIYDRMDQNNSKMVNISLSMYYFLSLWFCHSFFVSLSCLYVFISLFLSIPFSLCIALILCLCLSLIKRCQTKNFFVTLNRIFF